MLEIITETTNGKWRLSFDDAAPSQMQTKTICGADDQVLEREQEDDQQQAVDLGPGGEEGDLVAQPEQPEEGEQHRDRHGSSAGDGPRDRLAGGEQQVQADASTPA